MSLKRAKTANKSKLSDMVKLSPFLFQKSRQIHHDDVLGVKNAYSTKTNLINSRLAASTLKSQCVLDP
jgi:hypothetical protein